VSDTADIARAERGPLAAMRREHLRPVHSVLNVAQLALDDALLVAWFWLGWEYLPLWAYVPISLLACVIHQRAMSEWIHEAAHYSLTRSRRWNDALGNLLAGIWFALPVDVYRASHTAHHRAAEYFTDADPESVFLAVDSRRAFRRAILVDLVGGTMVVQYRRFQAERAQGGGGGGALVQRLLFALCLLGLVVVMAIIGRLDVIVLYYGSLITLYPLLNRLRTYGQHARLNADGTATLAGSHISRTTDCGLVDRIVFTSPRLLYHDDHHRYPYLPWRALVAMDEPSDDVNHRTTHRLAMLRAVYRGLPPT
jgi:fatty acid desaturase